MDDMPAISGLRGFPRAVPQTGQPCLRRLCIPMQHAVTLETKAGHQTRVRQMRMSMCRRKLYHEEPFDEWAQRLAWSLNKDLNNIGVFHTLKQPKLLGAIS